MENIQKTAKTLVELSILRAEHTPENTAFVFLEDGEKEAGRFTFYELNRRAKCIAAKLQSLNLKNERALLIYESGPDYLDSFFGCLFAGVISVPLHPPGKNKSLSRISAIAKDSGAKVVLSTKEISDSLKNEFRNDEVLINLNWIETETINDSYSENWIDANISGDTLAYLQYTSGSTGIPKGVMVNHKNLLTNLNIIDKSHPHNDNSVMVTWLPIHHDMGLIYGILLPFYCGYPCYFMTPQAFVQKPFRWLNAISKYKGTHNAAPNFAFELCVNKISDDQKKSLDLSSWTAAMNAAEPVRAETINKFVDYFNSCGFQLKSFCPGYGLAEGTLILSTTFTDNDPVMRRFDDTFIEKNNIAVDAKPEDEVSKIHVGHSNSIEDTKIVIVNPTTLIECKNGEIGEVWASGDSIAQGYWMRDDATKETFKAFISDTNEGPFLRTGDLGFIIENELYITGRLKDLIIIRGQNHYPQDIEYTVEASHPALRLGCVAAFSMDADGEEHLGIVQEIQKNFVNDFNPDEVVRAIRKAVSEEHDLQVYSISLIKPQTVPKTSSGKIQRKACHNGVIEGTLDIIAEWKHGEISDHRIKEFKKQSEQKFVLSGNNLKEWLINRISEMMQIKKDSIDTQEPFAAYGMDSLNAVELSGDLETLLDKELPATLVYDYPNINSLVNFLTAGLNVIPLTDVKEKISEFSKNESEPIAIIGIGLKFPEADNVNEFWKNLNNGKDSISKIRENRWDKNSLNESTVTFGGFIEDYDKFDPVFFGISPREAVQIDPQQRISLEVAWNALEDSGINPHTLEGKAVGVFMGVCTYDYARFSSGKKELFDVYTGTGTSLSIVANRISYLFDFRGPSIALDTACSSSLVALHTACQSLQSGQSSIALAGGVNLLLAPDWNIVFTEADMLAPDGRCKTFDADADGYVRSEGCGIVVLKKLSEAEKDGDRIYAVIKGSALNQDGKSNGITAPNGPSQVAVIKSALKNANVNPDEISYLETHGTGTPLGDPIEVNSIKEALNSNRLLENTLWIGSVKTNIGHLEAAAGIAGVIKTSLALFHKKIPKHLNYKKLNPEILIEDTSVKVADKNITWDGKKRTAGISSFGFGGTNAHVILQNAPDQKESGFKLRPFNLFTLSAKNDKVLNDYLNNYEKFLNENKDLKIEDVCFSSNVRFSHNHRIAFVCSGKEQLIDEIKNFKKGTDSFNIIGGILKNNSSPKIAFLFPGQGAQYIGMGKELYDSHPLFRKIINNCDEILRNYLDKPLLEVLFYEKNEELNPINETMYTQPALFAIEYALAKLWTSWGVIPSVMMGHSAGEYVAACLAGVFSLEDGLKLIAERGRLMQSLTSNGEMYTVFAGEKFVREALKGFEENVSIASLNSPVKTVISGNKDAISKILPVFDSSQTEYKKINVSIASHSPLMNSMIEEFRKVCSTVKYSSASIPVVSNINGEIVTDMISNADYWCDHILSPVRFSDSIKACVKLGCNNFIDLGPKPTSIGMAQETIMDPDITWIASIRKNFTIWETMLQGLGALYVNGLNPDWKSFDEYFSHKIISLPDYPFQKQRYWIDEIKGSRPLAFLKELSSDENSINDLTGVKLNSASENEYIYNSVISGNKPEYLEDHCVFGKIILPGASYIEMALSAGSVILKSEKLSLSKIIFHRALILEKNEFKNIQIVLTKESKDKYVFKIYSQGDSQNNPWILHSSGFISVIHYGNEKHAISSKLSETGDKISTDNFYKKVENIGIHYGKHFQSIKELSAGKDSVSAKLRINQEIVNRKYKLHPALLDAAFQSVLAVLISDDNSKAFIPVRIEEINLLGKVSNELISKVRINKKNGISGEHNADIELNDTDGNLVASVNSLQLKEVSRIEFELEKDLPDNWFYKTNWIEQKLPFLHSSVLFPEKKAIRKLIDSVQPKATENFELKSYESGIKDLDNLCLELILNSFSELGIEIKKGNTFSEADIRISPKYNKLVKRFLEILEDNGLIKINGSKFEFINSFIPESKSFNPSSFIRKHPLINAELELVSTCGTKLSQVINGNIDPLQLLFPDGDFSNASALYCESPGFKAMNFLFTGIFEEFVKKLSDEGKIRILEIGAGTGSSSSGILPILPESKTEYFFTDVSPVFFANAKNSFSDYPFVKYKTLDIEKDPLKQGFDEKYFDVIIASNVIHATKDLSEATDNIKKILKPGGLLILNEVTQKQNWVDLTFGLTDGWWRFADSSLRETYPLLTQDKWIEFLNQKGFTEVSAHTPKNKKGISLTGQSLILSYLSETESIKTEDTKIVFIADKKSAKNLTEFRKSSNSDFIIVSESDRFEKISETDFKLNFEKHGEFKKCFDEISESVKNDINIVYAVSHKDKYKNEEIENLSLSGCVNLLNIIQSLPECKFRRTPSLTIVTQDSQSVNPDDSLKGLVNSALWGMGKVISLELPDLKCRMIDLDNKNDYFNLMNELHSDPIENQAAFRDNKRFVARLEKAESANYNFTEIDNKGSYLISGGMGGLGIITAKWLAEKGAGMLFLTGRKDNYKNQKEVTEYIESLGTKVKIVKVDVSGRESLEKLFREINKSGYALKGIFHSAGVLEDAVLINQSKEKFSKVFASKITGSWNLHELSKKLDLDYFVLYSSVASLLGSAGQSNHSAANSFMDSLAGFRKFSGLPALSINWGVWSEIGSAAQRGTDKHEKIPGIGNINPVEGLKALEIALKFDIPQVGIFPMDWIKFNENFKYSYTSDLTKYSGDEIVNAPDDSQGKENKKEDIKTILSLTSKENHQEILESYLIKVISGIMGLEEDELEKEIPLNMMGLDSLMAIELKNKVKKQLGVDLNLVKYMEETNIMQLASELTEQIGAILNTKTMHDETAGTDSSGKQSTQDLIENLENLSDEELEKLLNQTK